MGNNVIKLKPPMCFSEEDAMRVCRELDAVLERLCELSDKKRAEASGGGTPVKDGGKATLEPSCSPF